MSGTARKKQETLVLFPEVMAITRKFSDEQFGILMRAAFSYRFGGDVYSGDDAAVDVAFQAVANQIDRYQEYCNTLSKNAKVSKGQQNAANDSKTPQSDTPIQSMSYPYPIQSYESKADKPPTRHLFSPPSVDDVRAYCAEKGYHVDPERFVDHYTSNGWMVGRSKMKDWRAAVRNWNRKDENGRLSTPMPDYGGELNCSL